MSGHHSVHRSGVQGVVHEFDAAVGLGTVAALEGAHYGFHCTAIADGSRTIAVGTEVHFAVGAAGPGRWEAFHLTAASGLPSR